MGFTETDTPPDEKGALSDRPLPRTIGVSTGRKDNRSEVNVTAELISRARAGDREAFAELVDPHRPELQAHCYRMLGSLQDAEDLVQETLLAAWLGLEGFEGRSSVRTWLYRIATNRCLNQLRSTKRRPAPVAPLPVKPPEPIGFSQFSFSVRPLNAVGDWIPKYPWVMRLSNGG